MGRRGSGTKTVIVALGWAIAMAAAGEARAQQVALQSEVPGHHEHDGFYLRLDLGIDYLHLGATEGGQDAAISGAGAGLGVALGGAVARNLVIYGELIEYIAPNPKVSIGGLSGTSNASVGVVAIGPGIAYYFTPLNAYLSATAALSRLEVSDSNDKLAGTSNWGFGVDLTAAKEWWVSSQWGLGVAAKLYVGSMKDKADLGGGAGPTWTATSFMVAFTATYN